MVVMVVVVVWRGQGVSKGVKGGEEMGRGEGRGD